MDVFVFDTPPRVIRVVSGGQSGADQGGLHGAKMIGIPTGGHAPRGFRTEYGPMPSLATDYGLVECDAHNYQTRTELNVIDSHATVVFGDIRSSGSRLTIGLCAKHKRPVVHCPVPHPVDASALILVDFLREVAKTHNEIILNVAGNRESVNPGIQHVTSVLIQCAINRFHS